MSSSNDVHCSSAPLIVGIGNSLMGDDGAGPYTVSLLDEKLPADRLILTTPGYDLISHLRDRDKVILIDAAHFGGEPGEVRRIERHEVINKKRSSGFSVHDSDLFQILDYADELKVAPKQAAIYCIQRVQLSPNQEMSPQVKTGAQKAAELITQEINGGSIKNA